MALKNFITSQDIRNGVWNAIDRLISFAVAPVSGRTVTASSTLALTDVGTTIRANSGSAVVFTIPNDSTVAWVNDTILSAYQMGAGTVSFVAGSGVTLRTPSGMPTSVQYSITSVMRVAANEWVVV